MNTQKIVHNITEEMSHKMYFKLNPVYRRKKKVC